ncbi:hypothetical protein [Herbinix hemicellulosilytica]|uniref:hypothetical protein n=1 Tax=Herbinix hemicellulosilytica TaxID=1564487 RepID=UPI000CD0D55B|nr:hypothetical protein [Herbinix hemicellulosilytica]
MISHEIIFLSILFWFVIIRTGKMAIEKIIVLFGGNEEMLKDMDATISLDFIENSFRKVFVRANNFFS